MFELRPIKSPPWLPEFALVGLVIAAQLLAVLQPEAIPLDTEEMYNAAHGAMIQDGHISRLLSLQYRSYCGGCSLNALLSAGIFSIIPPSLLAYKLVPIGYTALAVALGGRWLRQRVGLAATTAFALLFVFAPPTWLALSLIGWGNHMEAGCMAVVVIALTSKVIAHPTRAHAVLLGITLAVSGWIGFSSGFIAVGAILTLLILPNPRRWTTMAWVGFGCLPLFTVWGFQQWNTLTSPFEMVYYPGERLPDFTRIPVKLWSLVAPRQLVALFGSAADKLGWFMGWTWAAALGWSIAIVCRMGRNSTRLAVGFLTAFVVVYSLVRFTVWTPPSPHIATPGAMRYAAPIFPLAFLIIAAAIGHAWMRNQKRTVAMLTILIGLSGIRGRAQQLDDPFPSAVALHTKGADFTYFRDQASYNIAPSDHINCDTTNPDIQGVHAFGAGWTEASTMWDITNDLPPFQPPRDRPVADYFEGVGEWVRSQVDPRSQRGPELLDEMAKHLRAQPRANRIFALREAAWRRSVDWMRIALDDSAHDAQTMLTITALSSNLLPDTRAATGYAMGRRWAHDVARWGKPSLIPMPKTNWPIGFSEGLGDGLGERWFSTSPPFEWVHVPEAEQHAFALGHARGHARRWLAVRP